MARLSPFVPFGLVLAFQAWLWPFWPVFGLSDTLHNLTICEKDVICVHPSNCQQEAKLQPKVKVVVYENEADNSGKNHSTSTRNPIQTQETVYELSRSRRNEASFEAKAKRPTTKYKTKRKKQRKSNSWLRRHRKIV